MNGQRDGPTDRWNWNPSSFQPPSSISKPASLSKFFLFFDYLFSWKYTLSYATWYIIVYKFHKLYNNFLNISLVLSNQIPSPPRLVLRSKMGKPLVRVNCWYRIMCVLLYLWIIHKEHFTLPSFSIHPDENVVWTKDQKRAALKYLVKGIHFYFNSVSQHIIVYKIYKLIHPQIVTHIGNKCFSSI